MSRHVSASAMERAVNCPTSYALAQTYETTEVQINGTKNHKVCEDALRAYREGVPLTGPLADIVGDAEVIAIERSFIVDVADLTVRDLGESIGRNYGPIGPYEIPCTVDMVTLDAFGKVLIVDWKSKGRVTTAGDNWQIKLQALAVSLWLSAEQVSAGIVYLDNHEQDITGFDKAYTELIALAAERALVALRKAKANDSVHMGDWCKYCPAQSVCPGRLAIIRAPMPGLLDIDDEQAGAAYSQLITMQSAIEKALEILKERARRSPLPLPNGKRLALVECSRTGVDAKKAESMLIALGQPVPVTTTHFTRTQQIKRQA